ncbi:MAG: 2,3-bisphosphoglycerate-independent phosphoglycerate mutase [Gordonibacter sp.]|uniref:2,3-bisphosphoglycerate-independent phosphoglycerate mutase n=1 Tax=Gordonibacter sp. TaxID=1968902 RepID=UPI002FCC035B
MQYAVLILDGASGDPVPEFGGKTTFEASTTPNLDALARSGTVGLMQNVPQGMESGSDVACLSIAGYDPVVYRIGRGAIEGAALGIDLQPGQTALRLNLSYVENGIMTGYSTDNISTEDGHALGRELKAALDDETFTLHLGTSFRQVLVVNGHPELMDLEYETPHDNTGLDITQAWQPRVPATAVGEEAVRLQAAADLLADYVRRANEVLASSPTNERRVGAGLWPANHVWAFWPGMRPGSLAPFAQVYGKTCAMNSAVDLLDGIARLTDMRVYKVEGVTDGPTNDFGAQGRAGVQMLEDGNDVVVIHVEAPDAAGHDGRPDEKRNAVECSDEAIVAPLRAYAATRPLRIAVMPDHPTPLSTRKHSGDPVPFLVWGPGIAANGAGRLTEADARATGLACDPGWKLMGDLLLAD